MHDKMLNFFNQKTLAAAATSSLTSQVIDLRYNGDDIDHVLAVRVNLSAAPATPSTEGASAPTVTAKLQTSANGTTWTDVLTKTHDGTKLINCALPDGLSRYVRCVVSVGNAAMAAAVKVFGEITDHLDADLDTAKLQKWSTTPGEGPEKLAPAGDAVHAG